MMTKQECIEQMCALSSLAVNAVIGFDNPNDCFCRKARFHGEDFRHTGEGIAFVRAAVVEKIKRDGYKIPPGWTEDGFEINEEAQEQ